jgi:hypothetical protein|tara:strand:- start:539 stop:790 length:252 start_codon:yes stop_codon:yes gene_type:complete
MGRIIIGIILIIGGFLLAWKNEDVVGFTGYNAWAESKMGTMGGTRMLYKLLGVAAIFIGILAITNMHQGFLEGTVGRLLGGRL